MSGRESVEKWMGRLSPNTQRVYRTIFGIFMDHMGSGGSRFADYTPDELVSYQQKATNSEAYEILDAVQAWILDMNKHRSSYKTKCYAVARSFFAHNRAPLPRDPSFIIRGDKPKVRGRLTVEHIRDVVLSSNPTYRAVFLSMFQGGLGASEFEEWNTTGLTSLLTQLERKTDVVRIDLSGRKRARYERNYYTFIGRDAINAIRQYLDEDTHDEGAIFLTKMGKETGEREPVTARAAQKYWRQHVYALGFAKPKRGKGRTAGARTGMSLHELRDVFRSQWELSQAKSVAAEFYMGHIIDDLEYLKTFEMNPKWAEEQYRKAEPYLSIMSSGKPYGVVDEDEVMKLQKRIAEQNEKIKKLERLAHEKEDLRREIEEIKRRLGMT